MTRKVLSFAVKAGANLAVDGTKATRDLSGTRGGAADSPHRSAPRQDGSEPASLRKGTRPPGCRYRCEACDVLRVGVALDCGCSVRQARRVSEKAGVTPAGTGGPGAWIEAYGGGFVWVHPSVTPNSLRNYRI